MKKKSLKSLGLNKRNVSNLTKQLLVGGDTSSTFSVHPFPTDIACTLRCGGGTGPAPSANPGGSECKCK